MSHYTVLVHLTAQQLSAAGGDLKQALEAKLAPFNEQPEKNSPYLVFEDHTVHPWDREPGFRKDETRADVVVNVPDSELAKLSPYFSTLRTYAVLDGDGVWHAPGEMGWFGCDDSTGESNLEFSTNFVDKFIRSAGPEDLLVMVDCHI